MREKTFKIWWIIQYGLFNLGGSGNFKNLWRLMEVLIQVSNIYQAMSMFSYPRRISIPNFHFLHWVFRYEKHSCHLYLDWGLGGYWSFLIGLVKFDFGMNMISYLRRFSIPNFSFPHWVLRCKELSCPYCLDCCCEGH